MKVQAILISALSSLILVTWAARADTFVLSSGNSMECEVVQERTDAVVIRKGHSTFTLSRTQVLRINKSEPKADVKRPTTQPLRIPPAEEIIAAAAKQDWAKQFEYTLKDGTYVRAHSRSAPSRDGRR